jgi:hypothetical protein
MKRRALIVGSQTGQLAGVDNDVEVMASLLGKREFEVRRCTGADATRAGILGAYDQLIRDTEDGDASFVYYSGHGGVVHPEDTPAGERFPVFQFIVPTDFEESRRDDFRGILAPELSVLLARLIAKSDNVVVMLDCCHAAHMSRETLRPRALARDSYFDLGRHVERQIAEGLETDLLRPLGNRTAVRLVACSPTESAYEYPNHRGAPVGVFTESLQIALDEAGTLPVTWTTVMRRVRSRVQLLSPTQRPEVEGAVSNRLLFDTKLADTGDAVAITAVPGGRALIPGGRLLGITAGDEFAVMPAGSALLDDTLSIGTATVKRIASVAAEATVEFRDGHHRIPIGAQGFRTKTAAARRAVLLNGEGPALDELRKAMTVSTLVRPAEEADSPDSAALRGEARAAAAEDPLLAEVEADPDGLVIRDADGRLNFPVAADSDGAARVAVDLHRLSRAANVKALAPEALAELADPFTVECGRVVDGVAVAFTRPDEILHVGESIYVRLRNDSDRRLYFFVYDVGLNAGIQMLTDSDPEGLALDPGDEYVIGKVEFGPLVGLELGWPPSLPVGVARTETFVVIATLARQDLSALRQSEIGRSGPDDSYRAARDATSLQQVVEQAVLGGVRDTKPMAGGSIVKYAVRHARFQLSPAPAAAREVATFLIDERPDESVRLFAGASRSATAAPQRVAVRLGELTVLRNKAFLGADVRVDALVLTGGSGDQPVYRAATARFSDIRDGDRLPLDNMLVYHGRAEDYVDLAWWVSRDRTGSLALSDMLQQRLTAEDFTTSAAQLAGLAVTAPHLLAAVAAIGAAAVVVNTAYALLSKAVGDTIGVYRTSFLAAEDFGIGRHPRDGVLTAQGFAVNYTIQRVS